jgi:AcrR family transcriptional regulator
MSPSQQDRRETTKAALIAAARPLFSDRGFAGASADEIVRAAGVTRGALHHHFADKRGLFTAVFEQVEAELTQELADIIVAGGEGELMPLALAAFLDICERPDVRRIALTDAPTVLGWQTWREIEARYGLGLLVAMLADSPVVDESRPATLLAQIVLSAAVEGALVIAHADDPVATRTQVESSLFVLFGGLLGTQRSDDD